ncbi:MAK10-like protein [Tanacetum coccineum]
MVDNASGATSMNVSSAGQATASPVEGEKNTKDAGTNLKEELIDLLGKDVVTQYYTKKLLFDKYHDKMLKRKKNPKIKNHEVLTKKCHITLKIYREDGSDEVISNLKVTLVAEVPSASALQVLRRLGSIFTSVYAAKVYKAGKILLYVKWNKAISLGNATSNIGESLSEAWTRFKDLLQKVTHHGIDHVSFHLKREIDHVIGGKLRDKNAEESWALIEDVALYDNKIQCLMEAHLAPKPSIQVNKITSSCEICSGPHDTQYCMENPEQAFVDYASSCTDEVKVNKIETPKSKEPEKAQEYEFMDLDLKLPALEVLAHAPMYNAILDKYVKSLELGKNGSAFIQGEMPKKMKDPGLFTLPCRLGDSKPFNTLADLGSCVNLIPLYLFKKLKIGLLEETKNVLGLLDGTKSYPVGMIRNVKVHVDPNPRSILYLVKSMLSWMNLK